MTVNRVILSLLLFGSLTAHAAPKGEPTDWTYCERYLSGIEDSGTENLKRVDGVPFVGFEANDVSPLALSKFGLTVKDLNVSLRKLIFSTSMNGSEGKFWIHHAHGPEIKLINTQDFPDTTPVSWFEFEGTKQDLLWAMSRADQSYDLIGYVSDPDSTLVRRFVAYSFGESSVEAVVGLDVPCADLRLYVAADWRNWGVEPGLIQTQASQYCRIPILSFMRRWGYVED